jgi:hypothetical protein
MLVFRGSSERKSIGGFAVGVAKKTMNRCAAHSGCGIVQHVENRMGQQATFPATEKVQAVRV